MPIIKIKYWLYIFATVFLMLQQKSSIEIEAAALSSGEKENVESTVELETTMTPGLSAGMQETPEITTEHPTIITTQSSEVKKLLQRVQTTLEKAEPWLSEIEKEAKRLEQTAQKVGEGLIKSFAGIVGKLIAPDGRIGSTSLFTRIFGINVQTSNKNTTDSNLNKNCGDSSMKHETSSASTIANDENIAETFDVPNATTDSKEIAVKETTPNVMDSIPTTTTTKTKTTMKVNTINTNDWNDSDAIFNEI